jgi:hypothetical protein
VTAIADKLGVEFAIIHKKRNGRSLSAPEHMEILVGDVKDKVLSNIPCLCEPRSDVPSGCYSCRRYD